MSFSFCGGGGGIGGLGGLGFLSPGQCFGEVVYKANVLGLFVSCFVV